MTIFTATTCCLESARLCGCVGPHRTQVYKHRLGSQRCPPYRQEPKVPPVEMSLFPHGCHTMSATLWSRLKALRARAFGHSTHSAHGEGADLGPELLNVCTVTLAHKQAWFSFMVANVLCFCLLLYRTRRVGLVFWPAGEQHSYRTPYCCNMPDPPPRPWNICQPTYSNGEEEDKHTHTWIFPNDSPHGGSHLSSTEDQILLLLAFHDAFNSITLPSQV